MCYYVLVDTNLNKLTLDATNTQGRHEQTVKESAVKRESITTPPPDANSGNESNQIPLSIQIDLTQRNIDALMAQMVDQMETLAAYMRTLKALKQVAEQG